MLSLFVLVAVGAVTCGAVATAQKLLGSLKSEVDAFIAGIDARTQDTAAENPGTLEAHAAVNEESSGLETLLDEALQSEQHGLAVLALNELTGRAELARSRAFSLSRGLSRIGLLSGAGGAFALAALGQFERQALIYAGGSVVMGMICSFACQALMGRCRKLAKRYGELTDLLARQVEGHFKESEGKPGSAAVGEIDSGAADV